MRDRKADPFYPPDDVFWVWKPDPWTTHRQTRPLTWLAVHLCPTAAWVSGWWTLLGCRAGDRRLRVNPCPRHRVCTPPPHPLTRSSPSSLGNSQPPPPPPLLPLAATEPGKAVVAPPVLLFHLPTPPLLLLHARAHTPAAAARSSPRLLPRPANDTRTALSAPSNPHPPHFHPLFSCLSFILTSVWTHPDEACHLELLFISTSPHPLNFLSHAWS